MKRVKLFALILSIVSINTLSQRDTIYYFDKNNSPCLKENHKRKVYVIQNKKGILKIIDSVDYGGNVKTYKYKVKQVSDSLYLVKNSNTKYQIQYNSDSNLYLIKKYKNDFLVSLGYSLNKFPQIYHGKVMTYYEDSQRISSIAIFRNNTIIDYNWWMKNGIEGIDNLCLYPDSLASFNNKGLDGFREYIAKNLKYPEQAAIEGESGRVITQFVVMEDGSIMDLQILNDVDKYLKKEAIRVILSSDKKWTPAYLNGERVRTIYTFPIVFVLPSR